MKVEFNAHDECFTIDLSPETVADAAALVRFGINATKELIDVSTIAYRDGTFTSFVQIGKRKNDTGRVK